MQCIVDTWARVKIKPIRGAYKITSIYINDLVYQSKNDYFPTSFVIAIMHGAPKLSLFFRRPMKCLVYLYSLLYTSMP